MFGECSDPPSPSPWDTLSEARLVPELDEGNVEYKLQLLSPSPARFARLVTQLKWRLLEGGGQAYYELGVADSGMLVGLARQQLEESLNTLELMAGEIGASVIVVKEIQVPPEMARLAESQLERWDGRRSTRRKDRLRMIKHDEDSSTTDADESPLIPPSSLPAEPTHGDEPSPEAGTNSQLCRDTRRVMKLDALLAHVAASRPTEPPSTPDIPIDSQTVDAPDPASKEPRLIVEALVVRKLSLNEAFLDLEGFSLQ